MRLGSLAHDDLVRLIEARPFGLGKQHDLHDLADTLLSSESIVATLRHLSRSSLESLARGNADVVSRELMLADTDGVPYPDVARAIPSIVPLPEPNAPESTGDGTSVALHSVIALRDLVEWVAESPLPMGSTGAVLKAEERVLGLGLVLADTDAVSLVSIAEDAGLVRVVDRRLCVTSLGLSVADDLPRLWRMAVDTVCDSLGNSLLESCRHASRLDQAFLEWAAPLRGATETAMVERASDGLRLLGLVAGSTTELGRTTLTDRDAATTAVGNSLPSLESSVYVLDDLSIIAPGPLNREVAEFLSRISVLETRGLAPKRRLDPALVLRAVAAGLSVDEITSTLTELSLTPISAAVTSTIADIATNGRFVTLNGTGTDTAAKASHPELGAMLLTDPRLQRLAPVKVDDFSVLYGASRLRVETALLESRYTVVTESPEHVVVDPVTSTKLTELAEHLFDTGLGSTHLERALVTAGKSKAKVTLIVETSGGNKTITLEPRQVANGRVRGLDTSADVERTLPISAIIELVAVGE